MGHVICVLNDKYITTYYSRNLQENITMEDLDADGRIVLKFMFQKLEMKMWIGFMWSSKGLCSSVQNSVSS